MAGSSSGRIFKNFMNLKLQWKIHELEASMEASSESFKNSTEASRTFSLKFLSLQWLPLKLLKLQWKLQELYGRISKWVHEFPWLDIQMGSRTPWLDLLLLEASMEASKASRTPFEPISKW